MQFPRFSHCIATMLPSPAKPQDPKNQSPAYNSDSEHKINALQFSNSTGYEHRSASKKSHRLRAVSRARGQREALEVGMKDHLWNKAPGEGLGQEQTPSPERRRTSWMPAGEGRRRVLVGRGEEQRKWFLISWKGPGCHLQNSCICDSWWALLRNIGQFASSVLEDQS